VLVIVALPQSSSMTDDRFVATEGASSRQEIQRDHPGSALFSGSGSAIKRITAGVRAAV